MKQNKLRQSQDHLPHDKLSSITDVKEGPFETNNGVEEYIDGLTVDIVQTPNYGEVWTSNELKNFQDVIEQKDIKNFRDLKEIHVPDPSELIG